MKVGIQILNYNGLRWLPGLLDSLIRYGSIDQIIYLVDNCSTDTSVQFVTDNYPQVVIVPMEKNLGYGQAYNQSIPKAFEDGCDWVCLQNTDTIVTDGWLNALFTTASLDQKIGVMGPVFWEWETDTPNYYMRGRCPEILDHMLDDTHPAFDRDWIEGSSFFIRKECFHQIGGFDQLYFMYWEDAEYCRRARYFGWRVCVVPGGVCRHFAGGSSATIGPGVNQLANHFIYKLTDPNHGFLRNCFGALRLMLTYCKQVTWDHPNTSGIKTLASSIGRIPGRLSACHHTWKHLRAAALPTTGEAS
tara:strand:- start:8253 stop:9161 length:909 start_codon:yes stop_codon:yes gene_type:complete